MAPLRNSLFFLTLSAHSALAQNRDQITWGSVVFTYHGEKIPTLALDSHHLTPLGAEQLSDAGKTIRSRYISKPKNVSIPRVTDFYPIQDLSETDIENTQLRIVSPDEEYQTASAMAFMQGLYPPRGSDLDVSKESMYAPGFGGNGSLKQFPLDGYQYPHIEAMSELDMNSIWIAGHMGCDNYSISESHYRNTNLYQDRIESTLSFYSSLRSTFFASLRSAASSIMDFRYASQLYEYALFEYNHNSTLYNSEDSAADLATLYGLASEQQFALNSPNSVGTISTIAGRALAGKVLQQFQEVIGRSDYSTKLTLAFTSFEPFISFFSLSDLSTGNQGTKFRSLPLHGSVMAFELFSYSDPFQHSGETLSFPSIDDLFVRFLFRNGTSPNVALTSYPLFNRGNSETDMTWSDFVSGLAAFSLDDVSEWCYACQTTNLFCMALKSNQQGYGNSTVTVHSSSGLSPTISGVIGAVVTLGFAILAFVLLTLFGFRVQRREKRGADGVVSTISSAHAGGGGFKGAERLASDTDLRLKSGAGATVVRHERVGSWELNEGGKKGGLDGVVGDKDFEAGRAWSRSEDRRRSEELVNPFGDPVKVADRV